jgi:hypothetical protein
MLSHHDRRRLEAIERHLVSDDPRLAERFNRWTPSRAARWAALGRALMIVIGSLGMLAGILLVSPSVFLVFLAVLVGGCAWMARRTPPGGRWPGRPR